MRTRLNRDRNRSPGRGLAEVGFADRGTPLKGKSTLKFDVNIHPDGTRSITTAAT